MSKECTIHVLDEVACRIDGLRPEDSKVLWEKFGVFVDGYFHMPAYQFKRWDGKIRFFEATGKTFTKLLGEIVPYLEAWHYEINIDDKRVVTKVITDRIDENFFGLEGWNLRPYQVTVVNTLLEEGSGLAICATGAGKTSMTAALAMVLFLNGLQTIIIVPSSDLVTQTVAEVREKLGMYTDHVQIGEYSGGTKNIDCPIVVATWQALQNAPHLMSFFQAFIVDEAHGAKCEVIKKLVNEHGKHIAHRYGVTGTLPKPLVDQLTLKTSIGPVLAEVPAAWLIEQGYLSEVEIQPVETQDEDPELPDYASEKAYLNKNQERTEAIAAEIMRARDQYGNTFVLVNSIAQGQELQELIPDSIFLYGASKKDVRQENYKQFASQDGLIIIANSQIAATGLSIDRIFCLVMVDAGKSFIKAIQSIGRGLRKKGDKNKVFVMEIFSKLKFAKKHWKERKKHYDEAGYPVAKPRKLKV